MEPENENTVPTDEDLTVRGGGEPHFIIFSAANGEAEIARIDVRTGEVTYTSPEAGKEAADIFWLCFSDRIMEMVESLGVKDLVRAAEEVQKYLKDFGERKAGIGGVWGPLHELQAAVKKVKGEE